MPSRAERGRARGRARHPTRWRAEAGDTSGAWASVRACLTQWLPSFASNETLTSEALATFAAASAPELAPGGPAPPHPKFWKLRAVSTSATDDANALVPPSTAALRAAAAAAAAGGARKENGTRRASGGPAPATAAPARGAHTVLPAPRRRRRPGRWDRTDARGDRRDARRAPERPARRRARRHARARWRRFRRDGGVAASAVLVAGVGPASEVRLGRVGGGGGARGDGRTRRAAVRGAGHRRALRRRRRGGGGGGRVVAARIGERARGTPSSSRRPRPRSPRRRLCSPRRFE